jgi:hypothetical protein
MDNQELVKEFTKPAPVSAQEKGKFKHLMYCPFTGLGLYQGFRGNRWLKNRIKIFKQFVVPSLQAQSCQDFTLWISWRYEERTNPIVKAFVRDLEKTGLNVVHTYSGVCFYDDKYPPEVARERLVSALHGAMRDLIDTTTGETGCEWVLMTIQPSDDCYHVNAVQGIQEAFKELPELQAVGFTKGYLMNYQTREVAEWNPKTNPPFYTIKFPRPLFINPPQHAEYTGLKQDKDHYKKGTPLPSHEYVPYCLNYGQINERGFLVGTHGENISTVWNHPYKGAIVTDALADFGLNNVLPLKLPFSIRRSIFRRLPHKAQRKLRYWAGEKQWVFRGLFSLIYNGLRG